MVAWKMLVQRAKVRLAYRADFLITAVGDVLLAGVGLLFLTTLFGHLPGLGAWSAAEVLYCWGFAEAAVGLFFVAFGGLFVLNQRYIVGGELDRVLLRPLDPYAQVLLDNVSWEDVPVLALGVGAMAWAAPDLAPVEAWRWVLVPVLVVAAAGVLGGVLTAVSSAGFHLHHRGTSVGLVFQLSTFTRYPLDLFHPGLRFLLTFALPLGFAGFYPASLVLHEEGWHAYALVQPVVGLGCVAGGYAAFRFGLSRYASSGT